MHRGVELAQAVLERAPPPVVFQDRLRILLLRLPARDQEEIIWQQIQLTGARIRLIDHDQDQTLRVLPRLGLIRSQFNDRLVASAGRAAHRPAKIRFGQPVQDGIGFQPPHKPRFPLGQVVQHLAVRQARVDPQIQHHAQPATLFQRLVHKPHHSLGTGHVARPQDGVHEAVAQPVALHRTVVVADHREAGQERMIHRFLVVTVVHAARLPARNHHRKTVEVQRAVTHGVVPAGAPQVPLGPLGQRVAHGL